MLACKLQEGVFDMAVIPPARAKSCAVMRLPIRAHTFGAMLVILVSTKSRMDVLAAARASYSSHPCSEAVVPREPGYREPWSR